MKLAEKYAYKVYEKGSFSKAAEALYVSQPALSSMIAKLERELGFKIFNRSSSPLTLTPKGQIYIEMLEEMLDSEAAMYRKLVQLSKNQTKQLKGGTSIFLAEYLLPDVCKTIVSEYPDIRIKFNMGEKGGENVLSSQLDLKEIDFIIGYSYGSKAQTSIPIANTRTLIATRAELAGKELMPYAMSRIEALRGDSTKEIDSSRLHLFKGIPFITTDPFTGNFRRVAELTDNNYSLSCISITNIRNLAMNFEMMRAGLGATTASSIQLIHPIFEDEQIVYFAIDDSSAAKALQANFRSGEAPSEEALRFVEIFKELLEGKINRIIQSKKA